MTKQQIRTEVGGDHVSSLRQIIIIVATPQFSERRETGSTHPVLEVFVFFQVWRRSGIGVTTREAILPVWRWSDLVNIIVGVIGVFVRFARPRDALLRPDISLARGSQQGQVAERIYMPGSISQCVELWG